MAARLGIVLACFVLASHPCGADVLYEVVHGHPPVGGWYDTPQRAFERITDANGVFTERAYAIPGRVMVASETNSISGTDDVRAYALTSDFVITGPSGRDTVSATLYLTLHLDLEHSGVAADNSTGATATFWFDENHSETFMLVSGDATSGNGGSVGHDALAGYAGGAVNPLVSLHDVFPVGTPFGVNLGVESTSQTNGSGHTQAIVSAELGDAGGQVMNLPPGFTVNSVSWGVSDNQLSTAVAAVPRLATAGLALAPPNPNPSRGSVTLAYRLPGGDDARLFIFDLAGRIVRADAGDDAIAGSHRLVWDGRDATGRMVAPGIYFVRLTVGREQLTRRIVRLD